MANDKQTLGLGLQSLGIENRGIRSGPVRHGATVWQHGIKTAHTLARLIGQFAHSLGCRRTRHDQGYQRPVALTSPIAVHGYGGSIHPFFLVAHDAHPTKDAVVVPNPEVAFVAQIGHSELVEAQVRPAGLLRADRFSHGVDHHLLFREFGPHAPRLREVVRLNAVNPVCHYPATGFAQEVDLTAVGHVGDGWPIHQFASLLAFCIGQPVGSEVHSLVGAGHIGFHEVKARRGVPPPRGELVEIAALFRRRHSIHHDGVLAHGIPPIIGPGTCAVAFVVNLSHGTHEEVPPVGAELQGSVNGPPVHLIPLLAISAFAGIRSAELARLDWNAVDLDRRLIEIRAGQAKTASRRLVPITDNLAAWLAPLPRQGRVIKSSEYVKEATALARAVGIEWPRNVLRHSFITYRIAKVKSADQVALEAGNSASIIFKHYRELATEDAADQWFGILPKEGQWQNTITYNRLTRTVTLPE